MNPQDRELLDALNLRHERLARALDELRADLQVLNARLTAPVPPPLPDYVPPPRPQPVEPPVVSAPLPPLPVSMPPPPPVPLAPDAPGFEIQFGRWLARIGVVFLVLTLIFVSVLGYEKFHQYIGPWAKLGLFTLLSTALIAAGLRLERTLVVYGRTLAGGGLACLYYTLYGATYVRQLQVIDNPYLGAGLLLAWSAGVLVLAERRKSELLSIFAIALAYFSSAITPVGNFTMAANLLLAVTALVFLLRNAWTGLSYLCLIGTYLGFVRQVVVNGPDVTGAVNFAHDSTLFWPWTMYLTGAWLIFTAGVFLASAPSFAGGKRLAFLSLNNGAWAGLLLVAAELSHHGHTGGLLLTVGVVLVAACGLARLRRADESDLATAYLLQGLALGTAGITIVYHGVTRGLIITVESVCLAAGGAKSRHPGLRFGAGATALLGALLLLGETIDKSPFPWWLMAIGLAAMVANAWLERASLTRIVYVGLALLFGIRWIYGVVPDNEITLALFALATALVAGGVAGAGSTLIRAGLLLDLAGCGNYAAGIAFTEPVYPHAFTWLDATAFALFLAQPGLLRHWARELILDAESWIAVFLSAAMAWLFVSNSITVANSPDLTLGWALLALGLVVLGFAVRERRQRWCGLAILAAAFVRVAVHDFWGFSDVGKVLTFFALTVICLGLSFLYYKFAERFREWL